jgi:hypothetical protein
VVLTASCTDNPTSFVWTNCVSTGSTCTASAATPGLVTVSVSGVNAAGTGTPVAIGIDWRTAAPVDLCAQFQPNVVRFVSVPWGDYSRMLTATQGGFGPDTVMVMQLTIPSSPASFGTTGYTTLSEYQGPPTLRELSLSRFPCDFRPVDPTGVNGPLELTGGTIGHIYWNVGVPPLALVPGETYYFSYRNWMVDSSGNGQTSCPQSACNAGISHIWPH